MVSAFFFFFFFLVRVRCRGEIDVHAVVFSVYLFSPWKHCLWPSCAARLFQQCWSYVVIKRVSWGRDPGNSYRWEILLIPSVSGGQEVGPNHHVHGHLRTTPHSDRGVSCPLHIAANLSHLSTDGLGWPGTGRSPDAKLFARVPAFFWPFAVQEGTLRSCHSCKPILRRTSTQVHLKCTRVPSANSRTAPTTLFFLCVGCCAPSFN